MFFIFSSSYAAVNDNGDPVYTFGSNEVNAFDKLVNHPAIPLLDEQGNNVIETKNPYSPKKSCAGSGCHDYDVITKAHHFEMGRDEADDNYGAKRGLPNLVSPGYFGGYNCMGGSNPTILAKKNNSSQEEFADYGAAGFVKSCTSCHTGGGYGEYDRDGIRYDQKNVADIKKYDGDYYEPHVMNGEKHLMLWDWKKSGVVEADCMVCHAEMSTLKMPEDSGLTKVLSPAGSRSPFISAGFFREAATGVMEMVLNSDGKNLVTTARSVQPNPGMHGAPGKGESLQFTLNAEGKPIFNWNADAFNAEGRAIIPMLRFPGNDNCMQCHLTSNSRRGFYGFGESSKATIVEAGEDASDGVLQDDYQDDVHKGKTFTMDNGQTRNIQNCNACHDKQYYKSPLAGIDLDANHDFMKGNSDMDVRNDLDFNPNALSCEFCHMNATTPSIPSGHDSQLAAHRELWKGNGDMAGYSEDILTKITQTHFDVVSCQACHITNKKSGNNPLQILYRYREAEDGKSKMTPYNPRLRYYWKDKVSGRIFSKEERNGVFVKGTDAEGNDYGIIQDPITGEEAGRVGGTTGRHGFSFNDPDTYEGFVGLKKAYDSLLRKKGYSNPDTTMVWTESNEYLMSHNTRPSPEAVQCEQCHERKQSGAFSSLVSPKGIMGKANVMKVTTIPDNRLVAEGIITLDLPYMKLQANGDITENVDDILYDTKIDPYMTLLKNSSASEILGKFNVIRKSDLMAAAGPELAAKMATDFVSPNSYLFQVNKGAASLRDMVAAIDGNIVNDILFPTYRGIMGKVDGVDAGVQELLDARNYGKLRSDVFYFDVQDSAKVSVKSLNNTPMYFKVGYKGTKTAISAINVVTADLGVTTVTTLPAENILMLQPTDDSGEGFVILKTDSLGYFVVADK
ncbi:MAG: cytochrome C [Methylococcaceae bacterium]|nr:cytochrome C [Methylococcaceae bacterium]